MTSPESTQPPSWMGGPESASDDRPQTREPAIGGNPFAGMTATANVAASTAVHPPAFPIEGAAGYPAPAQAPSQAQWSSSPRTGRHGVAAAPAGVDGEIRPVPPVIPEAPATMEPGPLPSRIQQSQVAPDPQLPGIPVSPPSAPMAPSPAPIAPPEVPVWHQLPNAPQANVLPPQPDSQFRPPMHTQVGQSVMQQMPMTAGRRDRGWRSRLRSAAGGLITFGGTSSRQDIVQLAQRVRQPVGSDFKVAVLSLKGGVGKTTVTIGLGSALASLRGDRVIAVDANPDLGTLARRVPLQTYSTVRDLLADPNLARYSDIRRHTNQASSRLEVLASSSDPAMSEAFSEAEYLRVVSILENHYNLILTDCGTGLVHSAMSGVLKAANSLVLVTSPAIDGAQSAVVTLDWLNAHGYQELASNAIVVIASARDRNSPVDISMLADYFAGRTRAVQVIPYDPHLAVGAHIDLEQLAERTRAAFLELSATVVDAFAIPPLPQPQQFPGFGAQQQFGAPTFPAGPGGWPPQQ
ncbi:AAA family ATPase [Gordonia sp. CPCC 205333]|uniref:nucleotide-binding protein n=1 Tax=Gordonia sp. CPCC 205333 TaxID=3140790 RepID=UPI003AF3CE51